MQNAKYFDKGSISEESYDYVKLKPKYMDLLQVSLIFLILLLSIFLAITGFQVFFILRDLKKALDRLNKVLQTTDEITQDVEKPVALASNLITTLGNGAKAIGGIVRKDSKPKSKRFYKKVL